ncbi:dihydrofolate reductase [Sinomonas terrae]|uniref:Dihydrofolate reductase n=1 Tax=Sinomonas terrae TaxID=2908838 RepID=A0ABS9TXV7_9MICC|nr:dihydrofolate reductase [Sinomonas terrae]MCH6469259.1 dihydrofolate reductase [Sinomonas terrae]
MTSEPLDFSPLDANASPGVGLVWAQTLDGVIGRDGTMPWHVPEDLAHFSSLTKGHPVVMGRRTWESIPPKFRPFAGRTNIVVTRQKGWEAEGAVVVHSLGDGLAQAAAAPGGTRIWLIGGGQLFEQALALDGVDIAVVTLLDLEVDGDTKAPALGPEWRLVGADPAEDGWRESRSGIRYRITVFRR